MPVLFPEKSSGSLLAGLEALKSVRFDPARIRAHALTFDRVIYKRKMKEYCLRRWEEFAREFPQVHD